ncbi:uncharacterized protein LOC106150713 [Lingula anatina]|uniref:Uncharacterized protein LOC106150713 n=1 Tax=Lingula anatina TaxID=7574 RepID=A0A1S3GZM9_LINAN|nr:uncharacterized protein LOC106150713 [Lingula anatina]|eukprot:XP_013379132.1 uncharacterized protein LOC106150713 [Lingula anatina]
MKHHQKRALKQHMELLVSNITTPCLSYLLDKLIQEDIITDREKEYVRSKPSTGGTEEVERAAAAARVVSPEQTRTLLSILLTKEKRAFQCLCRCLEKNGQGFLAEQLKRS